MKKLLFFILSLSFSFIVTAQESDDKNEVYDGFQVGLNANLLIPVGTFSNQFNSGIGAGVTAKYVFESQFALGGLFNYSLMNARANAVGQTISLVSYGGLFEYYFLYNNSGPYLGIDIARYSLTYSYSNTTSGAGSSISVNSPASFGVAPNIGYMWGMGKPISFHANFKYNHVFNSLNNIGGASQYVQITGGIIFSFGAGNN